MRKIFLLITILLFHNSVNAQTELWGMTRTGGQYGAGSIYKMDANGNNKILEYSFFQKEGRSPQRSRIIEGTDGKFYGMTAGGGLDNLSGGVIFQYDAVTNIYVKKYDFLLTSAGVAGVNGGNPQGSLIQATNGKLYGLTYEGGVNNLGVMFQFDPITNVFTKLLDFDGASNGANPEGSLYQANDGNLYGVTLNGGSANGGVLFQYNPVSNTYTKKLDFNNGTIAGINPQGSLIQAADGMLYGMTDGNLGSIFQYDIATNNYVVKFNFDGIVGDNPNGALLEATDGKLYGATQGNGVGTVGTIFQYDPTTSICVNKYTFSSVAPTINGYSPYGSLLQATDGNLYGMAFNGGNTSASGVVFQYNISTYTYTKKYDFLVNHGHPRGTLMQASDGKLYGMNNVDVFKFDISTNAYFTKFNFNEGLEGKEPLGSLIKASDGKLYGLTSGGGTNNVGVLFQYDPITHTYVVKYDFPGVISGGINGGNSSSTLLQASDGNLYGMNSNGGANNGGVIFQYNISTNVFTKKIDFGPTSGVSGPNGNLIQANNGKLYGLSYYGGTSGVGTLFQYDYTSNIITKKIDFTGTANGSYPRGSLLQASDGMLYGMTQNGGISSYGVLFQYNPTTNVIVKKVDFNGSVNGANPYGNLIQATNGKLYGVTYNGGSSSTGVLFNYDPITSIYTNEINFGAGGVQHPIGSVMQATNGNFYGVYAPNSANYKDDGLYQFNSSSNTLLSRFVFPIINGAITIGATSNANLLEIASSFSTSTINTSSVIANHCYGNSVSINVPYTITGNFNSGNIFTAQLSDGYGSFLTPITIGTISATTSGMISSVISSITPSGNTYRIRVVSSSPALVGNDYGNIIIYPTPTVTANSGSICAGNSYTITPSGASSYTVSGGATVVTPTVNATYTISGTDVNGCVNTTNAIVNVSPLPTIGVSNSASVVCDGSSVTLIATGASQYAWSDGAIGQYDYFFPTVSATYTVTGTDLNNCSNTQTISVNYNSTCQAVWPGDVNSDGSVNSFDVLELGLHFNQSGLPRSTTSNNWQSYFANNWAGMITNGQNLNHSDCNGDGIINNADTLGIFNNYFSFHNFKPLQSSSIYDLNIIPDQSYVLKNNWGTASIFLGDSASQILNINGIAFNVSFDNTLIEPDSIWIEYPVSFMNPLNQNLNFRKLDFVNYNLYTVTTHTNNINVSGFGKIATLHYKVLSSLATDNVLNLNLSQANQSNASGLITPLSSGSGTLMAIGASVGINETLLKGNVMISPNPMNGILNISLTLPQNARLEIYNSMGALVISEMLHNKNSTINTNELSSGLYFVKVWENNEVIAVRKVVKQ